MLASEQIGYGQKIQDYANSNEATQGLFTTQVEALSSLAEEILSGESNLYFDKTAGSGKTRLALAVIEASMDDVGQPPQSLFLFPTHTALSNARKELFEYRSEWFDKAFIGEYHSHAKDYKKPIILTTNRSFVLGSMRRHFKAENVQYIFKDEAHHTMTDMFRQWLDMYSSSIQIGLTASPTYSAEKSLDNFARLAYRLSPLQSVQRGITAPHRNYMLLTEGVSLDNVRFNPKGDYNQKDLAEATDVGHRYEQIAKFIDVWKRPDTDKRIFGEATMAFTATIQQAENAAAFFNRYFKDQCPEGVTFAAAYHSGLTDDERQKMDEDFRAGKYMMMVTPKLGGEGYNNKNVSLVINFVPTISQVWAIQRGSRAGRIDENNPDKEALVIDVIDQSKKRKSLLYGEAIGGARFYKSSDIPPEEIDTKEVNQALAEYWKDEGRVNITGPRVFTPDELVNKYAAAAKRRKLKRAPKTDDELLSYLPSLASVYETGSQRGFKRPTDDPMVFSLREAMNQAGYASVRQVYEKWRDFSKNDDLNYHTMLKLAQSSYPVYSDEAHEEPVIEAQAFEDVIGMPLKALFATHVQITYSDEWAENRFAREVPVTWHKKNMFSSREERHWDKAMQSAHERAPMFKDYMDGWSPSLILPRVREAMLEKGFVCDYAIASSINMEMGYNAVSPYNQIRGSIRGVMPICSDFGEGNGIRKPIALFCEMLEKRPEDLFTEHQYWDQLQILNRNFFSFKGYKRFWRIARENPGVYSVNITQACTSKGQYFKSPRKDITDPSKRQSLVFAFGRKKDFTQVEPQDPPRWATWEPSV